MKFSIQSVLFVIAILSILICWILDHNQLEGRMNELKKSNLHLRKLIEIQAPSLIDDMDYREFEESFK